MFVLSAQGVGCVLHSPEGEGGPLNEVEWWVRCYSEFLQNSVIALFEKLLVFCDELLSGPDSLRLSVRSVPE